jgi:TM2 domain-containing membrane protein YozV
MMANPILAALLSFFVPGLGHIYAGEKKNGIIYVIITIFLWILSYFNDGMLSRVVDIIYSVIMAVDAYRISK